MGHKTHDKYLRCLFATSGPHQAAGCIHPMLIIRKTLLNEENKIQIGSTNLFNIFARLINYTAGVDRSDKD